MTFFNCQLQSCLANALEDCPNVLGKVLSIGDWNSNVVYVSGTLVSFEKWVQVLTHETWKGRHISTKSLCMSFISKSSAGKIEMQAFPLTVCPPSSNSDKLGSNLVCRTVTSQPNVVLRLTECWLNDCCQYSHPQSDCWFSVDPHRDIIFHWASLCKYGASILSERQYCDDSILVH